MTLRLRIWCPPGARMTPFALVASSSRIPMHSWHSESNRTYWRVILSLEVVLVCSALMSLMATRRPWFLMSIARRTLTLCKTLWRRHRWKRTSLLCIASFPQGVEQRISLVKNRLVAPAANRRLRLALVQTAPCFLFFVRKHPEYTFAIIKFW